MPFKMPAHKDCAPVKSECASTGGVKEAASNAAANVRMHCKLVAVIALWPPALWCSSRASTTAYIHEPLQQLEANGCSFTLITAIAGQRLSGMSPRWLQT